MHLGHDLLILVGFGQFLEPIKIKVFLKIVICQNCNFLCKDLTIHDKLWQNFFLIATLYSLENSNTEFGWILLTLGSINFSVFKIGRFQNVQLSV